MTKMIEQTKLMKAEIEEQLKELREALDRCDANHITLQQTIQNRITELVEEADACDRFLKNVLEES